MPKRLHELDSLRGIAAFSVMLGHVFLVFPIVSSTTGPEGAPWWQKLAMFSPLRVFWAGHEAVIFFFILSGFVLALLYFGDQKPPPYRLYLIKRILRIYPPYLVAALLAIAMREIFFHGPIPSVSTWFNQSWQTPSNMGVLANHFFMIGSFRSCDFNPVLWSLVHEMRISIVFPAIVWALVKHERLCLLLPIAFTFVYWITTSLKFNGIIAFEHDYFASLHYAGFFVVGAFLAKKRMLMRNLVFRMPRSIKWSLFCVAILAYSNAFWLPFYFTPQHGAFALIARKVVLQEWVTAIGVIVFIALALFSSALSGVLGFKPLEYLGAISYSLYLFHAVCLKIAVTLLAPVMPMPAVLGIAVVCALLVSTASWRYIEMPVIQLGKVITKRWYNRNAHCKALATRQA